MLNEAQVKLCLVFDLFSILMMVSLEQDIELILMFTLKQDTLSIFY